MLRCNWTKTSSTLWPPTLSSLLSVKLTLEEVMTTTAYLDLFLRSVTEPALLQTFLSFILLHQHDSVHILDTLVSRINTPFQVETEGNEHASHVNCKHDTFCIFEYFFLLPQICGWTKWRSPPVSLCVPQIAASCCISEKQHFCFSLHIQTRTKWHIAIYMQIQPCITVPQRQTAIHTQIYGQFKVPSLSHVHVRVPV